MQIIIKNEAHSFVTSWNLQPCRHKHRLLNDGVDHLINEPSAITIEWVTVVLALQVV